jgi:hypothetical protein
MSPAYLHFVLSLPQMRGVEKSERSAPQGGPGALIRLADALAVLRFKAAA